MPYIASEKLLDRGRRGDLDPFIKLLSDEMVTHGELNYCISRLAVLFLKPLISQGKKVGYTELNAVWADIQAAANEFYSQPIGDYEKQKKETNGDVYSELRGLAEAPRYPRQQATLKDWLDERGCMNCGKQGEHNCV